YNYYGCSDPEACNYQEGNFCFENCVYSPNAEFTIVNGNLPNAITYLIHDPEIGQVYAQGTTTSSVTIPLCLGPGCYYVQVSGMQISNPVALDFWQLEVQGDVVISGTGQNPNDNYCIQTGCTDPLSCNYNPQALFDNGTCDDVIGLIFIFNYGGNTTGKPSSFSLEHASGGIKENFQFEGQPSGQYTTVTCVPMDCYTLTALSFESNDQLIVTDFEGNVLFNVNGPTIESAYSLCPGLGCTNNTACNYDPLAVVDDGSCKYGTTGCTDPSACNYNPASVCADDSCVYPGCNDPLACNYDPLAGCNDGSCLLEVVLHINNFNPPVVTYNLFHPTTFVQYMNGNTPPNTNFTDIVACIPDECLTLDIHGLTGSDSWTLSIGSAVIASGNMDGIFAVCQHDGCTDLAACNYDPAAVHDNGTCFYLSGDFDGNHVINTSDLLLFMAAFGCGSNCGIYDLDGNGVVNTSDLLLFMSFFGTSC
ncbi:MAG: hypothetical protein JNM00_04770, partial [Flavobacteriales bacterium]|nr:hypothetical protein [Flavobacteriales bacterium]